MQNYISSRRQETPVRRSAEGSQGGVPSWLLEEHHQSHQRQQQAQGHQQSAEAPQQFYTPNRNRCHSSNKESKSPRSGGLCGSPDTRRTFYKSPRQQQREQRLLYEQQQQRQQRNSTTSGSASAGAGTGAPTTTTTNPRELRARPQSQMRIGNIQSMPSSVPIYLDIDPSIHQPVIVDASGHPQKSSWAGLTVDASSNWESSAMGSIPPANRLRILQCGISSSSSPGIASATRAAGFEHLSSRSSSSSKMNSSSPIPSIPHVNSNKSSNSGSTSNSGSRRPRSPNVPYVSPYVSPIAREYRVSGGVFQTGKEPPSSMHHKHNHHNNNNDQGLIMFGDDYDLGSITTGMSQQELLQKRRDVKKRRDEKKYGNSSSSNNKNKVKSKGKSKKNKERIVNMPPQLLANASWDTSLITPNNNNNNDKTGLSFLPITVQSNVVPKQAGPHQTSSYRQTLSSKWNPAKSLTPPEEETGSTDASTRESIEEGHHLHQQQRHQAAACDNASMSSFPLLSTNAKEVFTEDDVVANNNRRETATPDMDRPAEARVQYSQPGNIPQLAEGNNHQQQLHLSHHNQQQPQQQPLLTLRQDNQPQRRTLQNHPDIRQHGEELERLEHHLRYLEGQHNELEQEIQQRQRLEGDNVDGIAAIDDDAEYDDNRPRAVRFASMIARNMEDYRTVPLGNDVGRIAAKESPTSITQFDNEDEKEKSDSYNSVLTPKNLFQPKSILRKKEVDLDSTGRYPGANARGRGPVPIFTDNEGREVSPIRSPNRQILQQQPDAPEEEVYSIPDNLDDKDIAVLFDSETDADLGIEKTRREFDDDSGLISDAFIEAVAAIVLQTAIRRFLAIRQTQALRAGRTSVARGGGQSESFNSKDTQSLSRFSEPSTVQAVVDPGDPLAHQDFFYDLAAIQIQSVFRGWWVRDSINVDHYCAGLIQKNFRGFRSRMEYHYDLYRITLVQSIWRRRLVMRSLQEILGHHAGYSDIDNQSQISRLSYKKAKKQQTRQKKAKANQIHREFPKPVDEEEEGIWHVGAIIIQTYWRSYVSRVCYLQSLCDVVVVQGVARGWLTRRWLRNNARPSTGIKEERKSPFARLRQGSVARNATRFSKLESFESRNLSSLGADESVPSSVPFRVLTDDDPEQQQQQQPRKEQHLQQQRGHFDDPNRFGGKRNVWNRSALNAHHISNNQKVSSQEKGRNGPHHDKKYQGASNWSHSSPAVYSDKQELQFGQAKEIPRSKGWNTDEEIDRNSTRNLLMAWKQKDKANTFTIKPRPNH